MTGRVRCAISWLPIELSADELAQQQQVGHCLSSARPLSFRCPVTVCSLSVHCLAQETALAADCARLTVAVLSARKLKRMDGPLKQNDVYEALLISCASTAFLLEDSALPCGPPQVRGGLGKRGGPADQDHLLQGPRRHAELAEREAVPLGVRSVTNQGPLVQSLQSVLRMWTILIGMALIARPVPSAATDDEMPEELVLEAWDEDPKTDDLIGTAVLELGGPDQPIDLAWQQEGWFEVKDKKGKYAGEVQLRLGWAAKPLTVAAQREAAELELFAAVMKDDAAALGLLIAAGVDPNVRNTMGQTPLELARSRGKKAAVKQRPMPRDESCNCSSVRVSDVSATHRSIVGVFRRRCSGRTQPAGRHGVRSEPAAAGGSSSSSSSRIQGVQRASRSAAR